MLVTLHGNCEAPLFHDARAEKADETRRRSSTRLALYADRPIEDFTLDEVAERAGTTVQTVLRAYESKESLLLAALHRFAEGGASLKLTPPGDAPLRSARSTTSMRRWAIS